MTVISEIVLSLSMEQVYRGQGIRNPSSTSEKILKLSNELLDMTMRLALLEPAITYKIFAVEGSGLDHISLNGGPILKGNVFSKYLSCAQELAVIVCSIGPRLEEKVEEYIRQDDQLEAFLLDGVGNAAVDVLTQESCRIVGQEARSKGLQSSATLIPGMPGFPLLEQWKICDIVHAGEIGVRLTSSAMMIPRKSASAVLGLGKRMPTWTKAEACARCNLRQSCRYRFCR